jgi:hypothetical protein
VRKSLSIWIFPVTMAMAVGIVFWTIWRVDRDAVMNTERIGFQEADAPPGLIDVEPDPRLSVYSAWQVAMIPRAGVFDRPLGPPGAGGEEPVRAVADGLVVLAATGPEDRDMRVILAHKENGGLSQSIYGGLSGMRLAVGQLVPRGMEIGTADPEHFRFARRPGGGLHMPVIWENPESVRRTAADTPPSPLERVLSAGDEPWTRLEVRNAERFSDLRNEN